MAVKRSTEAAHGRNCNLVSQALSATHPSLQICQDFWAQWFTLMEEC